MSILIQAAARWLYPPTCLLCGAPGSEGMDLCPGCLADLPRNRPACPRCALPLPPGGVAGCPCGRCQRRPPPFDRCQAPFLYGPPLDGLITGLKYGARLAHARVLGELLARHVEMARPPDLLIPVPLHPRRLRERGFNQALEMARVVARRAALRLAPATCMRVRDTPHQTGLEARVRRRNLRGAFVAAPRVRGLRLAVIDDVVTTGATAEAVTLACRRAGAAGVEVWAAARTPPPG